MLGRQARLRDDGKRGVSSERLAFTWPLHFGFSAATNMHPSLRILKLSGNGKSAVRRSLIRLLEKENLCWKGCYCRRHTPSPS